MSNITETPTRFAGLNPHLQFRRLGLAGKHSCWSNSERSRPAPHAGWSPCARETEQQLQTDPSDSAEILALERSVLPVAPFHYLVTHRYVNVIKAHHEGFAVDKILVDSLP